jgi:hypothetical protein
VITITGWRGPIIVASSWRALVAEEMQANCLGVRVGRLHRIVARRFDQALRPLGLSLSQMEILSGLTIMGGR